MYKWLEEVSDLQQKQSILNFLDIEKSKAQSNGIEFILSDSPRVGYFNRLCNGYFEANMPYNDETDEVRPCMATAIGKPLSEWLPTFVHETSHMDQYLENCSAWMDAKEYEICDAWLSGEEFTKEKITQVTHDIILMEADCEVRALQKIKHYNLPVDQTKYAKAANAYLLFHHWMLEQKLWYNKAPYEIEEILNAMPSQMCEIDFYLKRPDQNIMDLFELCR